MFYSTVWHIPKVFGMVTYLSHTPEEA